ncbi:MAG: enoyl-CoA hydratase/isomerase family protein [Longimicrobiales bacterium]|nr:enoyl-CoA hydratase/isomerase family protein [Longimicrobiales bacterium]
MLTGDGEPVVARREERVLELTLNRPDRLNAVNRSLYERIIEELEQVEGDVDVRAVVLTGEGRAFCAGADLKAHAQGPPDEDERSRYIDAAQRANWLIQTVGVPVVAAVNGPAVGAGLELALSADLMIVAEDARLRLPEVALGTFLGGGVAYTLAERVGVAKARELVYFGDFFTGAEAETMGLANAAVAKEDVLRTARDWARRLAARAPLSLAAAKRLIGPAASRSREEAMEEERAALHAIFGTEDWAEGIAAHREGRPPRFTGR